MTAPKVFMAYADYAALPDDGRQTLLDTLEHRRRRVKATSP